MLTAANIIQFALALTIFFDIVLLGFLYAKSSRGPIFVLFMLHIIGVLGWAGSVLVVITTGNAFAMKLTFVFALILGVAKYVFVDVYPENAIHKNLSYFWFMIPVLAMTAISLLDNTIFTSFYIEHGHSAVIENGPYANIYALLISYLLIYPLVILFKKFKRYPDYALKAQFKYLLIGFSLFFLIGLLTNEILPVFFHIYSLNATGPIFSLILVAFTFYIITRYHFLDIRIIIQKSLIYAILLTITVGCYLMLVAVFGYLFQKTSNATTLFSAGITMFIGLWGTPFVERYFKKLTDPIFFKGGYDMTDAMRELTQIGNFNIALDAIEKESRVALKRILRSQEITFLFIPGADHVAFTIQALFEGVEYGIFSSVIFQDPSRSPRVLQNVLQTNVGILSLLKEYDAELALPILLEKKFLGMIMVGRKKSGERYNNTDIDLLENFSAQIAVAVEKAFLYKQVAEYSTRLEEKVADRTREIESLREEERQMMLDISHGLQTPLTIIKNEVGKIRSLDLNNTQLDAFEYQIDTVSRFIYDLLRLARLGKTTSDSHTTIDVADLVDEVVEYFEVTANADGIEVHKKLAKVALVLGDKEELKDAVSNILSNAIKYMSEVGERAIFISLETTDTEVILSVQDTGIGISEENLPRLSERFFRVGDNSNAKGTGLGLAITKRIIEKHTGTLTTKSVLGEGSTFTITLPKTF